MPRRPSLTVTDEDGGLVLRGAGELHLEVACDRLRSDFGVKASLSRPRVALRESVEMTYEQSTDVIYDATLGGQRLFCGLRLRIKPLINDEEAYEAAVPITTNVDATPLLREALEEGLAAAATRGVLRGQALAGVAVEALSLQTDGPATTPGAVRACGARAGRRAEAGAAGPARAHREVGDRSAGPLRRRRPVGPGDRAARKVLDVTSRATRSVIIANAPLETLLGYSTALRSLTQGEATFAQARAFGAPCLVFLC